MSYPQGQPQGEPMMQQPGVVQPGMGQPGQPMMMQPGSKSRINYDSHVQICRKHTKCH